MHIDYTSKTIFNEFVETMADQVREKIGEDLSEAGMFFLVVDECRDKSGHEQLSCCIRYSESTGKERFLGLIRLEEDFSAEAICFKLLPLLSVLSKYAVFIGLTTDGASVLFGRSTGLAVRLRAIYPWIINIHCTAHRLNLIIGKIATNNMPSLICVLKQLNSCFNAPTTSDAFEAEQLRRSERPMKIPGYSEVRWESMYDVTNITVQRFQSILITLVNGSQSDTVHATICAGLYHKMARSVYVEDLLIFYKVIALIQGLSKLLQQERVNWHQTCSEIKAIKRTLAALKGNERFVQDIISQMKKMCEECAIPVQFSNEIHSLRSSQNLEDSESSDYMLERVQTKLDKFVDDVCCYFEDRYSDENMALLEGLDALDATSEHYLSYDALLPLIDAYGEVLGITHAEIEMELLKMSTGQGLAEVNHLTCPNIYKLCKFSRTIASTSAEAERSFSTMNRVKTKVRNRLFDERTSDLTLLAHEADFTKSLDLGSVLDKFATKKKRRLPLLT